MRSKNDMEVQIFPVCTTSATTLPLSRMSSIGAKLVFHLGLEEFAGEGGHARLGTGSRTAG